MERLKEKYTKEVVPALMEKFGYKNIMQVPKLEKIVLNMGVGEALADKKILENAAKACPVGNSIHPDIDEVVQFIWA